MTKHISHGPAAEAVKGFVHLHAGRVIVVKGASAHAAGIDGKPISLCRLPGCDCLFDLREVDHGDSFLLCFWKVILPGMRKAPTSAKAEMEAQLEQFMLTSSFFLTTMILSTFLFSEEIT